MKRCSKCKEEKPLTEFPVRRASKDGLSYLCRACVKVNGDRWSAANPGKKLESALRWQVENRERANRKSAEWRAKNKERRAEIANGWAKRNPAKRRESVVLRRLKIVMPLWADRKAIAAFYARAAELTSSTGVPHHVDHLVPINSPLVCGLHVQDNLAVIPAKENVLKRNLAWPDMP